MFGSSKHSKVGALFANHFRITKNSKQGRKSERRSSSSKEPSTSSTQSESQPDPIWPPVSFLFVVNELPANEDFPPRSDADGRWLPPIYGAGFSPQVPGHVYRWSNGVITAAPGYQWYEGSGWSPSNTQLVTYRVNTVFYCNQWYHFFAAEGDASAWDIANSPFPNNRWYALSFRHHGGLSRIDLFGSQQTLAGSGAGWLNQLGLSAYDNLDPTAPQAAGLTGNLAILVALIAFSCRYQDLNTVLLNDRAWRNYQWRSHGRQHGRE